MKTQALQTEPSKYKQTEIGVFPEDWDMDTVINLASVTTGDKNTQDKIDDGGYPFFVRSSNVERINSFTFDGEAVLTAGDGVGTGKIFHYINGKFDFHQRVYKISDFCERLNGYFFYLYFSNNFYSRIMQMTAKSSVDSVRREMIADMKIPLPLPEEQSIISAVLKNVDALIISLERLVHKKSAIKRGAMQELLTGKRRLSGFGGKWGTMKLGEICEIDKGVQINRSELVSTDKYPVINGGIEPSGYTDRWNTNANTITISEGGNSCGYVNIITQNFWSGGHCYALLKVSEAIDNIFLYQQLKLNELKIMSLRVGSGLPNIQKKNLIKFSLKIPELKEEQTAIALILSDMDAEIKELEQKLAKYRLLKQGMMQALLTGKVRLMNHDR